MLDQVLSICVVILTTAAMMKLSPYGLRNKIVSFFNRGNRISSLERQMNDLQNERYYIFEELKKRIRTVEDKTKHLKAKK